MIKSLLLAAAFVAPMAQAESIDCKALYETARIVMEKRQYEASRIEIENIITSAEGIGAYEKLALAVVAMAYSQRAMSHPDNKKTAVARFANDVYSQCLNGLKK